MALTYVKVQNLCTSLPPIKSLNPIAPGVSHPPPAPRPKKKRQGTIVDHHVLVAELQKAQRLQFFLGFDEEIAELRLGFSKTPGVELIRTFLFDLFGVLFTENCINMLKDFERLLCAGGGHP